MTKINWKVRFKNPVFLMSFFSLILTFVYGMLGLFDIYPSITKDETLGFVSEFLKFLAIIGVIADPTTKGIGDSNRAQGYVEPWNDKVEDGGQNG